MEKILSRVGVGALVLAPVLSQAAVDVADVTAAKGDALLYAAAVAAALIAIWGAKLAYRKFFGG